MRVMRRNIGLQRQDEGSALTTKMGKGKKACGVKYTSAHAAGYKGSTKKGINDIERSSIRTDKFRMPV
jgi:hypothetical protein